MNMRLNNLVLQPVSLCNLNCRYCYLPDRDKNFKMRPEVAGNVADGLDKLLKQGGHVSVIWHAGEPLACNYDHFVKLVEPFVELQAQGSITHYIQTNATLIDPQWCDFFSTYHFSVGISIDGPTWANVNRVHWDGSEAFSKIMKGVEHLKKAGIEFTAIAVVGRDSLKRASQIYEFFCDLDCISLGVNIEEREGINQEREICDNEDVTQFWAELFKVWRDNPKIDVREFRHLLAWAQAVCINQVEGFPPSSQLDIFPTVAWNGNVVVLSPELNVAQSKHQLDFVVGNVLTDSLDKIIKRAENTSYVLDFLAGVEKCRCNCSYFSFCGGGQASNKFHELGVLDATETIYCRNSKQRLVDAVLEIL